MRRFVPVLIAFVVAGCSTARSRTALPGASPSAAEVSPSVQAFVAAVELLPSSPVPASASQVGDALTRLATALSGVGEQRAVTARAERIRVLASQVGGTTASPSSSVVVRTALREAVEVLPDLSGDPEVRRAADAADAALASFDENRPLLAQIATVRAILRHVANGLLASRGLPPAVKPPQRSSAGRRGPQASRPGALTAARRASGAVSALAGSSTPELRAAMATTLDALADAVAAISAPDAGVDGAVGKVRGMARALRREDGLETDAASRAKEALRETVDAVDAVSDPGSEVVRDWLAQARAAIERVNDHSFLSFQRAPLQEACRLLADVLVLTAQRAADGDVADRT